MQARLMFAAATAIKPDILIVDEVLGAGDAYFVAKSKARVQKMIEAGCTMLLVSHSMQQILELCDEAIWLEKGSIKMRGDSLLVVKAYEQSLFGQVTSLARADDDAPINVCAEESEIAQIDGTNDLSLINSFKPRFTLPEEVRFQNPVFIPHQNSYHFPTYKKEDISIFRHVARGGISRWESEVGIKIIGFSIQTERGFENCLRVMRPCKFILLLEAEITGRFSCMYGIVLNDQLGNIASRIWSPPDSFELKMGESKIVEMILNPLQIGPGEYTIGISVLEAAPIELLNTSSRYDLLGRSFNCTIEMDESLSATSANFIHTAEWNL
jgi:lipopolysaccharide transport system ATP-binding protein